MGSNTFARLQNSKATGNFFPRTFCTAHKKHDKREPGLLKEELRCCEKLCFCSKLIDATIERVTCTNSVASDSRKELWKTVEIDQCQSIAKC